MGTTATVLLFFPSAVSRSPLIKFLFLIFAVYVLTTTVRTPRRPAAAPPYCNHGFAKDPAAFGPAELGLCHVYLACTLLLHHLFISSFRLQRFMMVRFDRRFDGSRNRLIVYPERTSTALSLSPENISIRWSTDYFDPWKTKKVKLGHSSIFYMRSMKCDIDMYHLMLYGIQLHCSYGVVYIHLEETVVFGRTADVEIIA